MKLGFLLYYKEPVDQWINFAEQHSIDGIELQFRPPIDDDFRKEELVSLFKNTPVKPCACGLWRLNTMSPNKEEFEQNRKIICRFLETAAAVGSKTAFMNTGQYDRSNTIKNIAAFAEAHKFYSEYAKKLGINLAYYLGHGGNFINSKQILAKTVAAVPDMKLKLDPVGIIRNLKSDPYEIIREFGSKIAHFHVKDIYRTDNFEIEPPVGMGDLKWSNIIGMLYHFGYNGYIVIEPHGPMWSKGDYFEKHILLSKRHLEQYIV